MLKDSIKVNGHITLNHIRNGVVIDRREIHNLIVTSGKALASALLADDVGGTAIDAVAIGIGDTPAAASDTALESEIATNGGERRSGADVVGSQVTTTTTNDSCQFVTTYTFTGTFAVTEAGLFNDPTAGTLFARQVFAAMNVVSGDSLQVIWKVVFS